MVVAPFHPVDIMSLRYRRPVKEEANTRSSLPKQQTDDNDRLSVLDVVRIVGGLLLVNVILSLYVMGNTTWGYETRWTNWRYLKFRLPTPSYVNLTEDELSLYDGRDPDLPVYVAVNGSVYDVTSKRLTYGHGGPYSFFAGRDAARAYVTGCFQQDLTHDMRGLDEEVARANVEGWQNFYQNNFRYWYVGTVHHPPLTGDPPPLCEGAPAPKGVGS